MEHLKIEAISIQKLLENALTPFQIYSNGQLQIETTFQPGLPETVYWDERQIELLLHILVENSIDALEGKGRIQIELRTSPEVKNVEQPWIEIRISDNGPGIPRQYQDKIFEPHFSTKEDGSGLGLAFAQSIVQQHGGEIQFFSGENLGTVFVVKLPTVVKNKLSE